ncbi:MAG: S1 RNA-binding domain-containing protein, partial [Spirochaetota bacterium]
EIQAKAEMELKETLSIGDTISGEISSIRDFGFFVNLSGIEALVPKSEISWSRNLTDIKQKPGDTVTAKIIDINWNAKKITLSLRQMTPEPWTVHKLKENQAINGKVSAIIPQGAFIELEPGIDGFLHISRMSVTRKINKPEEILAIADSVNVKIREINEKEKKISLELITDEADPWLTADDNITKEVHKGIVENIKNSGISIRLNNGMLGFIPKGELLTSSDMQKNYRTGSEITASVKDFDKNLRKLILSEKGAIKKEEEKDYNAFLSKSSEASGTSLGGLFKDKFLEIQKQVKKQ